MNEKVYVADTYNHKIKVIDVETSTIETCKILRQDGTAPQLFNEPAGLCFDATGQYLLVSDTNNHQLICVDIKTSIAQQFPLKFPFSGGEEEFVVDGPIRTGLEIFKHMPLTKCKQLKLLVSVTLDEKLKFTAEAPQKWSLNSANTALKSLNTRGSLTDGKFDLQLQRVEMANVNIAREDLKLDLSLSLCDAKSCLMKRFSVILNDDDSALSDNAASNVEELEVKLHITPENIQLV